MVYPVVVAAGLSGAGLHDDVTARGVVVAAAPVVVDAGVSVVLSCVDDISARAVVAVAAPVVVDDGVSVVLARVTASAVVVVPAPLQLSLLLVSWCLRVSMTSQQESWSWWCLQLLLLLASQWCWLVL